MGEPIFTKTSSKIGSIVIVLILTSVGGRLLMNQGRAVDLPGDFDFSGKLLPDVDAPGWMGVGLSELSFEDGVVIIMVTESWISYGDEDPGFMASEGLRVFTEIVEEDVNAYCEENGFMWRFDFVPFAVLGTDEGVSEATRVFKELGVDFVIGYNDYYQCRAALDTVRENDMFQLAWYTNTTKVTDTCDGFYGLHYEIPETDLIPKMMKKKGLDIIVVIQDDFEVLQEQHGNLFEEAYQGIAENFEAQGGIIYDRIIYPQTWIEESDFNNTRDFTEYCIALDAVIGNAIEEYGKERVGVLALGISNDLYPLIEQGSDLENLLEVSWFCSPWAWGVMGKEREGAYAEKVGFYMPVESVEHPERLEELYLRINEKTEYFEGVRNRTEGALFGSILSPQTGYKYDACWLMALSVINAESSDPSDVEAAFRRTAEEYNGIDGNYALDEDGNRANFKVGITVVKAIDTQWFYDHIICGYYEYPSGELTMYEPTPWNPES